jgi:hypothetical protein
VEIQEETDSKGEFVYVAQWELIEPQTPHGEKPPYPRPRARTSHSCTVYKNRFMVIIGGEGELDEKELKASNEAAWARKQNKKKKLDDDICLDLDNEFSNENETLNDSELTRTQCNEKKAKG